MGPVVDTAGVMAVAGTSVVAGTLEVGTSEADISQLRHGPGGRVVTSHGPGVHISHRISRPCIRRAWTPPHFWHGRWWYYGVGPCWVWSDYYGEYVWACDLREMVE